jgi:hypothetical protein
MGSESYADCLRQGDRLGWEVSDVMGGRHFDAARPWLPTRLSAADRIGSLSPAEKVKLTHVEMGAYAHLFGCVEEFIAPTMAMLARDLELDRRAASAALGSFAAEEMKHLTLFREVRASVERTVGFPLTLLPGVQDVARSVMRRHTAAVLLLTAAMEWLTHLHHVCCLQADDALDPFTHHILRSHWLEEAEHARIDHLETLRAFRGLTAMEKDRAVDDFIALIGVMDGLLQTQAGLDVENLQRCLWRRLPADEQRDIRGAVLAAKRYAFIESGVTHPGFVDLLSMVTTPAQRRRLQAALVPVLTPPA